MLRRITLWLSKHSVILALRRLDSAIAAALIAWKVKEAGVNADVLLIDETAASGIALGHVLLVDLHPFLGFSVAAPCILVTTLFGLCGIYALPGLQSLYEPKQRPSTTIELVAASLGISSVEDVVHAASRYIHPPKLRIPEYYELVERTVMEGPQGCIEVLRKKAHLLSSKPQSES